MHATLLPSPPLEWQAGATEPRACQGSVLPTELHSQPVLQVCGGGVLLAAPASLEGNLCLSLPSVGPPCPWLACVFWTLPYRLLLNLTGPPMSLSPTVSKMTAGHQKEAFPQVLPRYPGPPEILNNQVQASFSPWV